MKIGKNGSQKMLIIGPKLFFTVLHGCPNQPRIDFSYHKYVPRLICLLICGQQFLIDLMNSESFFKRTSCSDLGASRKAFDKPFNEMSVGIYSLLKI